MFGQHASFVHLLVTGPCCLKGNSGGRVDRVRVKNVSPAEGVKAGLLEHFHFVKEATLYERCSGYAMEVSF